MRFWDTIEFGYEDDSEPGDSIDDDEKEKELKLKSKENSSTVVLHSLNYILQSLHVWVCRLCSSKDPSGDWVRLI